MAYNFKSAKGYNVLVPESLVLKESVYKILRNIFKLNEMMYPNLNILKPFDKLSVNDKSNFTDIFYLKGLSFNELIQHFKGDDTSLYKVVDRKVDITNEYFSDEMVYIGKQFELFNTVTSEVTLTLTHLTEVDYKKLATDIQDIGNTNLLLEIIFTGVRLYQMINYYSGEGIIISDNAMQDTAIDFCRKCTMFLLAKSKVNDLIMVHTGKSTSHVTIPAYIYEYVMKLQLSRFLPLMLLELPLVLNELHINNKLQEDFIDQVGDYKSISCIPKSIIDEFINGNDVAVYQDLLDDLTSRYV